MIIRPIFIALLLLLPCPSHSGERKTDCERIISRWYSQHGIRAPRTDEALRTVARENSQALAEISTLPSDGISTYLKFLLEKNKIRDAIVQATALRFTSTRDLKSKIQVFLGQRTSSHFTHVGSAVIRGVSDRVATIVLLKRRVHVTRIQTPPSRLNICWEVHSGSKPHALVTLPDLRTIRRFPKWRPGRRKEFCATFPRARKGTHNVEIVVDGPLGPEVAALFPLYIGSPGPRFPVYKIYPSKVNKKHHIEIRLFNLVNRSRRQANLAPLRPSGTLASVARTHSFDMKMNGFFGHRSPTRGNLGQRLAAAGLDLEASENLALSTSPRRAHEGLMTSPVHRQNILDPALTHLGIGVARDSARGLIYVTQCFANLRAGNPQ